MAIVALILMIAGLASTLFGIAVLVLRFAHDIGDWRQARRDARALAVIFEQPPCPIHSLEMARRRRQNRAGAA